MFLGQTGVGHQRWQLDQAFNAAQALGKREQPRAARYFARHLHAAFYLEREHAPEATDHLALRQRVLGMARQARVIDALDQRVLLEKTRDLLRVAGVLAHPQRERLEPAQH